MAQEQPESDTENGLQKPSDDVHGRSAEKNHQLSGGASEALDRLDDHASRRLEKPSGMSAEQNASSMASFARFAAMGVEFFGVILIFGLVGHWLDDRYGFGGIATIVAVLMAFVGEMYLQIKTILRKNKQK
ncbi:MAG: AtpZ/AtpI family protein [Phycisphaerales bacterium]|nr:AtpZ/AtpI family protein [Phycisphaerales bacterium]